jgi:hypothetical protein
MSKRRRVGESHSEPGSSFFGLAVLARAPGNQRGGQAKRSFRAFDTHTKKWLLLAALSGCIIRVSFPHSRYPKKLFLRGIQKGERP